MLSLLSFEKGFILQHSLYIAISRLVRYCQWGATILFLVCVYVAAFSDNIFFEPVGRSLFIIIALIPPALFLVGLYFFESQNYRVHESRKHVLFSAAVFLMLASPAISMNWRYSSSILKDGFDFFLYAASFLFVITSALPAGSEPIRENIIISLLLHYKRVMHDAWRFRPVNIYHEEPPDENTSKQISMDRAPFYSQRVEDLLVFQNTLTCPELDADVVSEQVIKRMKKKQKLAVVDVGGGDGRFTARLVHGLANRQFTFSSVLNIDPAPGIHDLYVKKLVSNASLQRSQIQCDAHEFEEMIPPQCDLLIASHSLYAIFDKARVAGNDAMESEIRKLLNLVRAGGMTVLIMSSTHSQAISAKRNIYHKVFGSHRFDTVAEDIEPYLNKFGLIEWKIHNDSLINLTDVLLSFANDRKASHDFIKWASYFLRCDLGKLPKRYVEEIAGHFYSSCFKLHQLPESMQNALKISQFGLHLESLVLPHKCTIYLLKPVATV
jgi:phospholipid N-methyltransferase